MSALVFAAVLSLCTVPFAYGQTIHRISVIDFAFSPNSINAVVGDTIIWTLTNTTHPHTITQGTGCTAATGGFNSGYLTNGTSFTQTLTNAGTINYFCAPHCANLNMIASINVVAAPVTHTVTVGNYAFSPASLTIAVNDIVVFHLIAGSHNVQSTTTVGGCTQATNGFLNSAAVLAADYSVTFNQTGSFPYMCSYHCTGGQMFGQINVVTQLPTTTPAPGHSGASVNKAQSAVLAIIALAVVAVMHM